MINKNELLSDLLDEQCSSEELTHLLNDKTITDSWYRYSTVSAILKNEHAGHVDIDFSQKMSALIANEPAIIATQSSRSVSDSSVNTISDNLNQNVIQFKKTFGGFAIAASVAVATFFSVQTMQIADVSVNGSDVVASSGVAPAKGTNTQSANSVNNSQSQEQYNDLYQLNTIGSQVPVGAEYVKTIRLSAEQWQELLKRAAEQKSLQTQTPESVQSKTQETLLKDNKD